MFRKKHVPLMHARLHTYAYHAHTHDSLYAKVHTCTHCVVRATLHNFVVTC